MDLILIPLLACHLLAMNVASAGPLVAVWQEWRESRGDATATIAANFLGRVCIEALLVGSLLGVVMGTLLWNAAYSQLWTVTLRYKATSAIGELLLSLVFLFAYAVWRKFSSTNEAKWRRIVRSLIAVIAGGNLLYHFPFLFAVATSIQSSVEPVAPLDKGALFREWMAQPDVLARVTHVVLASFAVTGVLLMGVGMRYLRKSPESNVGPTLARRGAWLALVPSLLQIPIGLWLIAALPPTWQNRVLGGDVAATAMLGVSLVAVFIMLQDFATIAFGEVERKSLHRSMICLALVVLLMTGVLRRIHPLRETTPEPVVTLATENAHVD